MSKEVKIAKGNWTTTYNDIFRAELNGKKLSPEAWGLYVFMLSLPDTWDYTIMGLTKVVNAGRDKIGRMLKELQNAGFIYRIRKVDKNNKFIGIEYTIHHQQQEPQPEKPDAGLPALGNQPQLSTKGLNPKELDKKKNKGENPPVLKNHYLTDLLIKKNIIEIIDLDLENYNLLFKDLDNEFGYKLVLDAARYLIDYLTKNKNINSLFNFISNSMNNNLTKLVANKKNNKPEMLNEYLTDIQNMDADNEIDKLLNEHWNNTPILN